jgi:hypothetical protein
MIRQTKRQMTPLICSILCIALFMQGCASQEPYQSYTDTHNMSAAGGAVLVDCLMKPVVVKEQGRFGQNPN